MAGSIADTLATCPTTRRWLWGGAAVSEVIIRGRRVRYDNTLAIGKGGEADIFNIGNSAGGTGSGEVLKLFKQPDHPDLTLDQTAQAAAVRRIKEHQVKLPALLNLLGTLPASVVMPQALATNRSGEIVGYTMLFLSSTEVLMRYGQRSFRQNVATDTAIAILRDLHGVVDAVHGAHVTIGDFNDLNILVDKQKVSLIDADSMQFGQFPCMTYTATFVDPKNCDSGADTPVLVKPHSHDSDWYAFAVMVMQTLLFVGPYGGVAKGVLHNKRPLLRKTVFDASVRYPKPAISFSMLPDELLHHLQQVFVKDVRGAFPVRLLERLRWTKCSACGVEHGRPNCPSCATVAPGAVKEVTQVRGRVVATRIFPTSTANGVRVLRADVEDGKVMWLYLENGRLHREGGIELGALSNPSPHTRFRLRAHETIMGMDGTVVRMPHGENLEKIDIDAGPVPMFDANATNVFWSQGGVLCRDNGVGVDRVGDVLRGQTMFWVGPSFGFGIYRAGSLNVAFVFTASSQSMNDMVKLAPVTGLLIDAAYSFTKDRAWFFTTSQDGPRTVNRCTAIHANGDIEATAEAEYGDESWLGKIRGSAAAGSVLLIPTDGGVVQVKLEGGHIVEAERFPDTEPFVDSDSKLLVGGDGLYVVTSKNITRLVISRKAP
jgi:hypothetical protein